MKWPVHVWDPLLPKEHHYIHPPTVHFPITLFCLELVCLVIYFFTRSGSTEKASRIFLYSGALSLLITIPAGLYDAGVDANKGNPILAGLQDRLTNYTKFSDALSVHVLYVSIFVVLILVRIVWRRSTKRIYPNTLIPFIVATAINIWILLAVAQVGGSLTMQ
jgi:uncharacterized membrane protein